MNYATAQAALTLIMNVTNLSSNMTCIKSKWAVTVRGPHVLVTLQEPADVFAFLNGFIQQRTQSRVEAQGRVKARAQDPHDY